MVHHPSWKIMRWTMANQPSPLSPHPPPALRVLPRASSLDGGKPPFSEREILFQSQSERGVLNFILHDPFFSIFSKIPGRWLNIVFQKSYLLGIYFKLLPFAHPIPLLSFLSSFFWARVNFLGFFIFFFVLGLRLYLLDLIASIASLDALSQL